MNNNQYNAEAETESEWADRLFVDALLSHFSPNEILTPQEDSLDPPPPPPAFTLDPLPF